MPEATVEVNSLKIYAFHGVDAQETVVGNDFEVTVHLNYPCGKALTTDLLEFTINYAQVVYVIKQEMKTPSKLIENVVFRIFLALKKEFPRITGGSITVRKLHPPVNAQLESCGFTYRW